MDIEGLTDLIVKCVTGASTPEEDARLEAWLAEDEEHRALYERLQDGKNMTTEYYKWKSVDGRSSLHDMEHRIDSRKRRPWFVSTAIISAMSAAVAIVAIVNPRVVEKQVPVSVPQNYIETIVPGHTMATLNKPDGSSYNLINEDVNVRPAATKDVVVKPDPVKDSEIVLAMNDLKTPRGGEFHIILEDSTEVWLNAESSLEYPEVFGETERSVKITGEAYFKVAKDPKRPFFVSSYGQLIRVYGTEFGISSYPEDDFVYTTLVEGKIGVLPDKTSSSVLYLSPDHQSVYAKGSGETVVNAVNAKLITSWKEGQFIFEDQTFRQIMVSLSRWYDFEYKFMDESVAGIQFKGKIPRYGKFSDILEVLEKSGGLSFRAEGNCIVISKKQQ